MKSKKYTTEALLIFGQNVKRVREKNNLSIQELATRATYDRVCLSQLEYGEHNISYLTAIKLAEVLNISFPILFSRNFSIEGADRFHEDDFLLVFTENLKRELRVRGMTQTRIYIESGIQESVISKILNGKTKQPMIGTLWRMAVTVSDGDLCKLFIRKEEKIEMEGRI